MLQNPDRPWRLMSFTLLDGVDLVVLCGGEPSLAMVQGQLIAQHWVPLSGNLQQSRNTSLRGTRRGWGRARAR